MCLHENVVPSHSIDQLVEVVRHHIESATKVQHELTLVCTDFFVDGDLRVLPIPSPPPRPSPQEMAVDSTLTILQLQAFYNQLLKVAPSGQLHHLSSKGQYILLQLQLRLAAQLHRGTRFGLLRDALVFLVLSTVLNTLSDKFNLHNLMVLSLSILCMRSKKSPVFGSWVCKWETIKVVRYTITLSETINNEH